VRKVFLPCQENSNLLVQKVFSVNPHYIKKHTVSRNLNSKKGDNGIVLVVGGSSLYHGAPVLASMAALRCGADLVYTGIPKSISLPIRSYSPNIIALPMPDDRLTVGSTNRLLGMLPKIPHTATIGMGMSISKPEALSLLVRKLLDKGTKLLLDASALIPNILDTIAGSDSIITPHAGEYRRIFGESPGETEEAIVSNVTAMAEKYRITIILKGWVNIIANSEKKVARVARTTPAMTVGGTGDVLDGIASSLFAKLNSFDASVLAVYFNGIAANLASEQFGLHLVATDLIDFLPKAMKNFDAVTE
jgi:ADP-dependent NAD(P)H-hydrate dehydratase